MKNIATVLLVLLQFAGFSQSRKITLQRANAASATNNVLYIPFKVAPGVTVIRVSNGTVTPPTDTTPKPPDTVVVVTPPVGPNQFVVPTGGARTSAAAYKPSDGVMVRTLWSGIFFSGGTYLIKWDGSDDAGNPLPVQNYNIKVLTNNVSYTYQGVLANTSTDIYHRDAVHRTLDPVIALIMNGSKVHYAAGYNEGNASHFIFDTTNIQVKTDPFLPYGNQSTNFIVTDGTNNYFHGWDNYQQGHSWVYATKQSDNSFLTFPNGTGSYKVTYGGTFNSTATHRDGNRTQKFAYNGGAKSWTFTESLPHMFWKLRLYTNGATTPYDSTTDATMTGNTVTTTDAKVVSGITVEVCWWQVTDITAMAVSSKYLFVARENLNTIEVLDKVTGASLNTFSNYNNVRAMICDIANNTIWVAHDINQVEKYNINNTTNSFSSAGVTIAGLAYPCDMKIFGGNIVIVDGLTTNKIKAYAVGNGGFQWELGQTGGNVDNPVVANDRFAFWLINEETGNKIPRGAVAFAADGSMWVADPSNRRILHFDANRNYLSAMIFQGKTYSCYVDPAHHERMLANMQEFEVNYNQSDIQKSWVYKYNWEGHYLPDYVLNGGLKDMITLSNGRTYATVARKSLGATEVVELDPTFGIRPTNKICYLPGVKMYPNGDLYGVEAVGISEKVTWKKQVLTGFLGNDPVYSNVQTVLTSPVASDNYYPRLSGAKINPWEITKLPDGSPNILVSFRGNIDKDGNRNVTEPQGAYHLGGMNPTTGVMLWKTSINTRQSYVGEYPYDGSFDVGNGPSEYAGNVAVAMDRNIFWGFNGEFWKSSQCNMWNHYNDNGLFVGQYGATAPQFNADEVKGAAFAGNAFSPAFVKEGNDYYMYVNDESVHGGILRFKISNLSSIAVQDVPLSSTYTRTTETFIPAGTRDLMSGLPFISNPLPNNTGYTTYSPTNNGNFTVQTGPISFNKRTQRDITFQYWSGAGTASFNFDLGANTSGGWKISGLYKREGYTVGNGADFGQLQVLDGAGKLIATLDYITPSFGASGFHNYANGVDIGPVGSTWSQDPNGAGALANNLNQITITATSSSSIKFDYGDYTLTVPIKDNTANWQNPKTLRFYATGGGQKVSMQNFTFAPITLQ